MAIIIDNSVKNKKDTPSITSDVAANLPAATDVPVGAIYIETDTGTIKQSDGITWQILGGGGGPGTQDLASVLSIGNTATNNIVLNGAPGNGNVTAASIVSAGSGEVKIGKSTSGYVELRDSTERKALLGDGTTDVVKFRCYNNNSFIIDYDNNTAGNIQTLVSEQPLYEPASPGHNLTNFEVRPNINSKLGFGSTTITGFYYNPLITNAASVSERAFVSERGRSEFIAPGIGYASINNSGLNINLLDQSNGSQTNIQANDVAITDQPNNTNNVITGQGFTITDLVNARTITFDWSNIFYQDNLSLNTTQLSNVGQNLGFYDNTQQVSTNYGLTGFTLNYAAGTQLLNIGYYDRNSFFCSGNFYFQNIGLSVSKTFSVQEKETIDFDFTVTPTLTVDGLYCRTYFCFGAGGNIVLDATQYENGVIVYLCIDHGSTGNVAVTTTGTSALLGASPINKSGMYSVTYNANLDTFAISHV